jgi:endonuclease/exonuclease/phosphatase family metal-dependent hydrolase
MFTVMTWNVENLFRPTGPDSAAQPAYQAKLDSLAGPINASAPDLLALQEIGGQDALDDLTGRLTGSWHSQLSTHADGRGIRVAFLSRQPLTDPVDVVDYPTGLPPVQVADAGTTVTAMGRGALAVTTTTPGGTAVRAVTTHLKSKLLSYPGGRFFPHDEDERARYGAYALFRRAAEAATVRHYLTAALAERGPDRPLLLLGDLNDTPNAATTQLLLGPPGSEIGTRGFDAPDRGDSQRMWNLAPLMPDGKNYSRINNGRPELIDHVLVSAALVHTAANVRAFTDQPLPSLTADPGARKDAPASDHAPVIATFTP